MIKNVIFDFGQVMIQYKPHLMADKYITDDRDRELIYEVVFDRKYWDPLDDGSITDEQIVADCRRRLPERLHGELERIYYNWVYNLPEMPGMNQLVADIRRELGVRVFLLSNISSYFAERADELPVTHLFERCFYSSPLGMIKPSAEIFEHVLAECALDRSETLFVDDSEKNVRGAERVGISGYIFDGDADALRRYIYSVAGGEG